MKLKYFVTNDPPLLGYFTRFDELETKVCISLITRLQAPLEGRLQRGHETGGQSTVDGSMVTGQRKRADIFPLRISAIPELTHPGRADRKYRNLRWVDDRCELRHVTHPEVGPRHAAC